MDKVTKHRIETSAIRQINNSIIDNYKGHKIVDKKIFLGLIPDNIFTNDLSKSKSFHIKTVHVREI